MKVVLQRVTHAQVTVEEQVVGKIGHGFLLLLGVEDADTVETADRMVEKICKLRAEAIENITINYNEVTYNDGKAHFLIRFKGHNN